MKYGKKYVDVMDDVELSRVARTEKYQQLAASSGAPLWLLASGQEGLACLPSKVLLRQGSR